MTSPITAASGLILRRSGAFVALAGVFAASMALSGGGASSFEQQMRAFRNSLRAHPASGAVHIVEMDKRSIDAIGRWPWPRRYHAQALDKLVESGAKSVAFDVDFSSTSNAGDDRILAAALKRAGGNVVLPTMKQEAGSGSTEMIESEPIPMLREQSFMGTVSIQADRDGYIRSALYGLVIGGSPRPSLAALVAETAAPAGKSFTIDYAIDPRSIPRHSFIDVIEGRVPPSALRGKRVIIGATAVELGDRYAVPGHGVIAGVVIQALAAETLFAGSPGDLGWLPALILAAAGIALLASRAPRTLRVAGFSLAGGSVLLLPLLLESFATTTAQVAPALGAMLAAGTVAAITHLARKFRHRTMIDAETGLPNLNSLTMKVKEGEPAFIAVAQIDQFAATASALGPEGAADLVRRLSERMMAVTRGGEIHRVDHATLAWAIDRRDFDDVGDMFEGLAALMRAPVEAGGRRVDVAITYGVASGLGHEIRQLVANASLAASNAAKAGERWQLFTADHEEDSQWRLSLLGELDEALASGDIWVAYQPKYSFAEQRITGSEALVRWQHATRGPIPPDLFIPAVEAHGRIGELTMHVLKTALHDAAIWSDRGQPFGIAVNISVTLLAQPGFVEQIQAALDESGLPAATLTLEVTESAAMMGSDAAIETLERLRDLGIKLSVDDYGTGQSTLTYLKRLPACELKIDKSFVQSMVGNRSDAILVRSTIELAHELGLSVVGEGVEDAECLAALAALGCDTVQGYLIGRPMPSAEFLALAASYAGPAIPQPIAIAA